METIKANYKIIIYLSIMFIISLITLYNADYINISVSGIIYKQLLWYLIGIVAIIFIINLKNRIIINYSFYLYIFLNIILLLLLLFGDTINNARCWFKIPGIGTIQPSEFMKIILIIFISKYIYKYNKKTKNKSMKNEFIMFIYILLILIPPCILTFLEPDTGAVFMYLILTIFILYISGISKKWIIIFFSILLFILSFIMFLYFFNINLFIKILGSSFFLRIERLTNWVNTSGMQLKNGITAIGTGGIFGNLFINDLYFPEAHTDFIFAVFASNFGFIGCLFLIMIITLFDLELINISIKTLNKTNKYIIIGFVGILIYQQIQNIGMTFGLLPITGITLPFISYGGSSLLSYMIMIGIIMNINLDNYHYHN
ncbi:MAG TPA: FtsW/RodA/SpoVE family cell cycle protein [Bacilli bacterium]|nr:FtsW/RodA/SpoVE family cell cycle protein [Bacilli bacterium]